MTSSWWLLMLQDFPHNRPAINGNIPGGKPWVNNSLHFYQSFYKMTYAMFFSNFRNCVLKNTVFEKCLLGLWVIQKSITFAGTFIKFYDVRQFILINRLALFHLDQWFVKCICIHVSCKSYVKFHHNCISVSVLTHSTWALMVRCSQCRSRQMRSSGLESRVMRAKSTRWTTARWCVRWPSVTPHDTCTPAARWECCDFAGAQYCLSKSMV